MFPGENSKARTFTSACFTSNQQEFYGSLSPFRQCGQCANDACVVTIPNWNLSLEKPDINKTSLHLSCLLAGAICVHRTGHPVLPCMVYLCMSLCTTSPRHWISMRPRYLPANAKQHGTTGNPPTGTPPPLGS